MVMLSDLIDENDADCIRHARVANAQRKTIVPVCTCGKGLKANGLRFLVLRSTPKGRVTNYYKNLAENFITKVDKDDKCIYCKYYVEYMPISKFMEERWK